MTSYDNRGGDPTGFSSFLKESARLQEQSQSEERGYIPVGFLRRLKGGPRPVREIAAAENLDVRAFARLLNEMVEAGLVEISTSNEGEILDLTPEGSRLLSIPSLAR